MKIVTVIGARPQFVKAAAVSRAIAEHNATLLDGQAAIHEIIVHTGQHFDANMSDIFFDEMQIPHPDYHLEINSVGHGAMTGRMLEKIEEVLLKEKPDYVLVYGDTNSTLAGALAAKKLHIKVVHVEAGLRSFNMRMPEEINRILTDRISDILCCPTDTAVQNLSSEGFRVQSELQSFTKNDPLVVNTGDVMLDAALFYSKFSAEKSTIISSLALEGKDFVLCTIHRAENTDDLTRLDEIILALNEISSQVRIVLPLHPRTRMIISRHSTQLSFATIDPVGYFDMIELLKHASCIMTDSGGLQKEAFFFKKPCITLRDETEWVETVEMGCNTLVGPFSQAIVPAVNGVLQGESRSFNASPYGCGDSARKILAAILRKRPQELSETQP